MKKWLIAGTVFLALGSIACKKDVSGQSAGEVLGKGEWTVSYYYDKDKDETGHFAGYRFRFDNGKITATNGSQTYTGTYADGTDDSTPKLIIQLSAPEPFSDLNDDWHVIEKNATLIKLEDQSGSGGTEYLNFTR